jgi:hypothetical protein
MRTFFFAVLCVLLSTAYGQKIGFGAYPFSRNIAFKAGTSCFLFETGFHFNYHYEFSKVTLGNIDVRAMYAFKRTEFRRFYTGAGIDFRTEYYSRDMWFADGYYYLVPLGVEVFLSERVPELGLTLEANWFNLNDWYANIGLFYYFKK